MPKSDFTVKVSPGFEKLAQTFRGFERILAKKLREGIWGYGLLVERGSKMLSPYDTGAMRRSIGVSMPMAKKGLEAFIHPNIEYAIFVHEGTVRMRARPFMKWGLNAYRREGDKLMVSKIKEATQELARVKQ